MNQNDNQLLWFAHHLCVCHSRWKKRKENHNKISHESNSISNSTPNEPLLRYECATRDLLALKTIILIEFSDTEFDWYQDICLSLLQFNWNIPGRQRAFAINIKINSNDCSINHKMCFSSLNFNWIFTIVPCQAKQFNCTVNSICLRLKCAHSEYSQKPKAQCFAYYMTHIDRVNGTIMQSNTTFEKCVDFVGIFHDL